MANDELMRRLADAADARAKWGRGTATTPTMDSEGTSRLLELIAAELRGLAQRAPQHGAVPGKKRPEDFDDYAPPEHGNAAEYWSDGWNACRAAMLAAPAPEADSERGKAIDVIAPDSGVDDERSMRHAFDKFTSKPEAERAKDEAGAQSLAEMCAAGRAHNRWTLRQAEAETGVSNALISQIETGKQDNPTLRVLSALTRAYGLNPSSVLGLTAHPAPPPAGQPEGIDIEELAKWCDDQSEDPDNAEGAVTLLVIAQTLRRLASAPQSAEVRIDFPGIGHAGPFRVMDGEIALPAATMTDLAQHFRMGYVAQSAGSEQQGECAGGGRMSIAHWIAHLFGWNTGRVVSGTDDRGIWVGFECDGCGGISDAHYIDRMMGLEIKAAKRAAGKDGA